MPRRKFIRVLPVSERLLADIESDKKINEAVSRRVQEIFRLRNALAKIMKEDFIGEWLDTPNEAFEGLKPLELIERGEIDQIWRMIHMIEWGIPL